MLIDAFFSFLKYALLFFLIIVLYRAINFYLTVRRTYKSMTGESMGQSESRRPDSGYTGETVKCYNCGTYVATELSINVKKGGRKYAFCSEECKESWATKV